jgi:hypothetical protein
LAQVGVWAVYHHLVSIIQNNIDNASRPTSRLKARDKRKTIFWTGCKRELVRPRLDCEHVDIMGNPTEFTILIPSSVP